MAGLVSIATRIRRQLARDLAAVAGDGSVHRYKPAGDAVYQAGDVVLINQGEQIVAAAEAPLGYVEKRLAATVGVILAFAEGYAGEPDDDVGYYQALIEQTLCGNRAVVEDVSEVRLAIDLRVSAIGETQTDTGQSAAGVQVEVHYRHDEGNPFQHGAAIPLLDESES